MPENSSRLQYLYDRFIRDEASPDEVREFWTQLRQTDEDDTIRTVVFARYNDRIPEEIKEKDWSDSLDRMLNRPQKVSAIRMSRWWAAAILLVLVMGSYFLFFRQHAVQVEIALQADNDVPPGGNKAILTLANGKKIILDSADNGQLANQGNTKVMKVGSGLLAYEAQSPNLPAGKAGRNAEINGYFNTLTTPRGGQYQVVLPDGTKVWLNAASSIRYPTAFTGEERMVEITGEAYFEVRHNARLPFKVKAGKEIIEDVGTHFNVNAYRDEPVLRTTVAEGVVRIGNILLYHGEQASINPDGKVSVNKDADVAKALAWKNGYFSFGNSSLQTVMRQLCRWYDVQVTYVGNIPNEKFGGDMPRNSDLSEVLKILKTSGVKFTIEGRNVRVTP
jgi:ferric-dicitrate binding protein FerR (iron transport regulator)